MIPTRLITSGCSYTEYCWSTWASILGSSYPHHINVGQSGADNATIARNVLNVAQSGDIVVILWSSFDRWSQYSDKVIPIPANSDNHWRFNGSIVLDKNFFVNYYNSVERFQTTMDYVQLVDLHSKHFNYTVYNFSAFPFLLGEAEKTARPELSQIFAHYNISNNHLLDTSLYQYMIDNNQEVTTKHMYSPDGDTHPLPTTHWEYVNKIIAPKLNATIDPTIFLKIVEESENIVKYSKLTPPSSLK